MSPRLFVLNDEITFSQEDADKEIVKDHFIQMGSNQFISMSKGIFVIDDPTLDVDYMIDCANYARINGKDIFGTTTFVYNEQMKQSINLKNKIVTLMQAALDNREFYLVFQPQYREQRF